MADSQQFELASTAHAVILHNALHFLAISILYYDHLLTSRREIDYVWRRQKSNSSYYFFLNRYFAFFGNLAVSVLGFTNLSIQRYNILTFGGIMMQTYLDGSCKRYNTFRQVLLILTQVFICYFLSLRIYALYQRSLRVLIFIVGTAVVLVAVVCWALFGQKSSPSQMSSGCHIGISRITAIRLAGAWEALFVFDSMIFGLTLYKSWSSRREYNPMRGPWRRHPTSLLHVIVRDGALYFAVIALANLSNILSFYLGGPFTRGILSTLASSVSVTMMSRLMLNLHETAEMGIWSTQRTSTDRTGSRGTEEMQENVVELDTFMTGSTATCSRYENLDSASQIVSGLERIEEEEGARTESTRVSSMMSSKPG